MIVILEGAQRQVFQSPRQVITAHAPAEVPAALEAVSAALAAGCHVAGWLGYELGYALEARLASAQTGAWTPETGPLLMLGVFDGWTKEAPQPRGRAYAGPLQPEWDMAAYQARFDRVKAYIVAGDIYQANLSFRAGFAFLGDSLALYERLLAASGAGHAAYAEFFDEKMEAARQILSLSPELFFELAADGHITTRPMKGTAPRSPHGGNDAAERAALAASPKNRAENLMIVDLIRNDLSRIAAPGSVAVDNLFAVETYPTLHTMVSTVRARKRESAGLADTLKALFPCGSVTGAPKIRAMEILRDLEVSPRGAYCGAIGCFSPDGSARFNVAIRTLTIAGNRGTLGLGGGVVQDSQGADEYAECLLKARFFTDNRRPLQLIETLKWDGAFVRLKRHLARMKTSAIALRSRFDPAAAMKALERAVAGKAGPLRVRLTLDEAGSFAAAAQPLPPDPPFWRYRVSAARIASGDLLQRHKTDWRELYDQPLEDADETLFCNEHGELVEGSRSTVFIRRNGVLLTPPLSSGALPGVLRAELLETGHAAEAVLTPADLAGEIFLGNSLRGLVPAKPA